MFALVAILGTGLAICAGEAIAIGRQPVRRAQCADCHSVQHPISDVSLREHSCGLPGDAGFAIAVDVRTGEHLFIRYPACIPPPLSDNHGR